MSVFRAAGPLARPMAAVATLVFILTVQPSADEGMWTFDHPPTAVIQQRYGFTLTPAWLDHLRLSSVRFNDGGSGSFVSPDGLVLTNHHVALGQLQKLSTPQKNYAADGFFAKSRAEEMKATDLELNVLMSTEDVTARIAAAAASTSGAQAALDARRAEIAKVEKESLDATGLRSDVVTFYQGAQYRLYRYKKYTDVRLVFAPEQQMAFFGGDPDNFTYPRFDLDFAIFRVYENGAPIHPQQFLKWNAKGAGDQELVFVTGHPGSTDRDDTVAELETDRDVIYPIDLQVVKRRIGVLRRYAAGGAEQAREASELTFALENALKAETGEYTGLLDPKVMNKKTADERALRDAVSRNPAWQKAYGAAWDDISRAEAAHRRLYKSQRFGQLRGSQLAGLGLTIVRYVTETAKPDGQRLNGYHDAQLPSLRFELLSPAPVYPALEEALLADSLQESLDELGPDDPFIKAALGGRTPAAAAAALIGGTKLADPAARKPLLDGGAAAVAQSTDPLVVLGRALEPLMRDQTRQIERDVTSVESTARQQVGQARFAVFGTNAYPDATFTLRLSYGIVSGYPMNGTRAPYKTTFGGLFDRSAGFDGKPPFNLVPRFAQGKAKLDLSTPLDFVTTNDIIGGNSGSPVVNKAGELVGLIFDGNIESLVGRFVYDDTANRAVAVHSGAIVHALRTLYGAGALADELESAAVGATVTSGRAPLRGFSSSVGMKLLIGVTGFALFVYLLVHIAGNLMIFFGPDAFNKYAYTLEGNPLIPIIEIGLLLIFLVHIYKTIRMFLANQAARPVRYAKKKMAGPPSRKSLASSTMIVSGLWLLIFIVIHVRAFRYGTEYPWPAGGRDLYRLEMENFANPMTVGFYVLSMVVVGSHLWHGISSSVQSLGLDDRRWTPRVRAAGKILAVLIAAGFIVIALWVHFAGAHA